MKSSRKNQGVAHAKKHRENRTRNCIDEHGIKNQTRSLGHKYVITRKSVRFLYGLGPDKAGQNAHKSLRGSGLLELNSHATMTKKMLSNQERSV